MYACMHVCVDRYMYVHGTYAHIILIYMYTYAHTHSLGITMTCTDHRHVCMYKHFKYQQPTERESNLKANPQ